MACNIIVLVTQRCRIAPAFIGSALLFIGACQNFQQKEINIVFRLDDYSARSSTELEQKIIDDFRAIGASITFGVIPFIISDDVHDPSFQPIVPLSALKADILRKGHEDGTLDIALHGYSHQTTRFGKYTEFSDIDYNIQIEKLGKGKKYIENIIGGSVNVFIPPWNSYDSNTLRALKKLNFSAISASLNGGALKNSKLKFLPATTNISGVRDAIVSARRSSDIRPLIVVLFHLYDFVETDEEQGSLSFKEFSDLLNWINSQKDIRLLSISQATEKNDCLDVNRFRLNNIKLKLFNLLPTVLHGENSEALYRENAFLIKMLLTVCVLYIFIAIIASVLSFLFALWIFPKSRLIMYFCMLGGLLLSLATTIYAFHDFQVTSKGAVIVAFSSGMFVSFFLSYFYMNTKVAKSVSNQC